jgi:TRAP-type uncharacterized transport system fused permease subunit
LFIFYFGMLSTITPPVCLAAYTAASLAKTDPMKTGWECMRLGVLAYIVPFIFALSPSLLLIGPWESVAPTIFTALIATFLLGVGLVGYLFRPIGAFRRLLFIVTAAVLFVPIIPSGSFAVMSWLIDGFGLMAAIALVTTEWTSRSNEKAIGANESVRAPLS